MFRLLFLVGATALLSAACTPPELTDSTADFEEVAPVLAQRCGLNSCHGDPANGNFQIPGGQQASVDDVRSSLEGVDTLGGTAMVAAGAPDASAIHIRITAEPPQLMPPNDRLNQREIALIRQWIQEGAVYE